MEKDFIDSIKLKVANLDRSKFDDRCEILRLTSITEDMSYDDRLLMFKIRYGF